MWLRSKSKLETCPYMEAFLATQAIQASRHGSADQSAHRPWDRSLAQDNCVLACLPPARLAGRRDTLSTGDLAGKKTGKPEGTPAAIGDPQGCPATYEDLRNASNPTVRRFDFLTYGLTD